jgi:hypothetical protein
MRQAPLADKTPGANDIRNNVNVQRDHGNALLNMGGLRAWTRPCWYRELNTGAEKRHR